ncbi:DUF2076 domain-containing protein [Thiorhodococcus fuscus]|uniref:DUF2076 domain-containing protein n=1 Tax=Thiorhodococcus fuscus TaxID=527200 RepID=A0ABW4Y850_9GAMM
MNVQEQTMIEDLFQRLRKAESRTGPRDVEAESLILDLTDRQPAAPYYMAQAILVQEQALHRLQERVEELERAEAERPQGGGFLGGLFGANPQPSAKTRSSMKGDWNANRHLPSSAGAMFQPSAGGGGFLSGAVQTAMGVAGGMLIGNAIADLFSGEEPSAESPPAASFEPADGTRMADVEEEDDGGFFDGFGGGDDGFA